MTTRGQDGATSAGAHAQAEAMGLRPTTVVGLKGALAHEILRYCTAIRRSALKGGAGTGWDRSALRWMGSTGDDRPQSEGPRPRTTLSRLHGQAKTALKTGPVQGTGSPWARSNSAGLPEASLCDLPANPAKPSYAGPARPALSGDTPGKTCFSHHHDRFMTSPGCR